MDHIDLLHALTRPLKPLIDTQEPPTDPLLLKRVYYCCDQVTALTDPLEAPADPLEASSYPLKAPSD